MPVITGSRSARAPKRLEALGINIFRYKMYAVVLSAAMTSLAGVIFAFFYNNLFPEQIFHISRSIELILGPIIGGIGTLVGPLVGAFLLDRRSPKACAKSCCSSASKCRA